MSLHVYNSLTKQKEPFEPLKDKTVNMYTCGVTVYDKCHIGHARSLYIFDVIRRYLVYRGYAVSFIRNITDIDDKIINRAKEVGVDWKQVSKDNIDWYHEDLKRLGIAYDEKKEPRATDNIEGMIKHIAGLIEKGYAYEVDGDVYFSVRAFTEYGKLSGQSIEQIRDSVRIEKDPKKKDPLDFALWKKSGEGESFWDSPWGSGRPGWHIECSVMSLKHLGCETLDIHGGGRDLVFPHHENEIAQAESLTGKPFAKYWLHHGLLTINGQKMSKSLGNFITVEDAVNKYELDDLKFFFLSSHYASPIDFTDEKIHEAHKARQRFTILFAKAESLAVDADITPVKDADFIVRCMQEYIDAMDDDFNTPRALGALFEFVNDTNKFIDTKKDDVNYAGIISGACLVIKDLCEQIFGLSFSVSGETAPKEVEDLLTLRKEARTKKDFARSDEIRDQLKDMGIIVEDDSEGQTWRRA